MISYDFHLSLVFWLSFVTRAIERVLEERFGPHGIGLQETKVLGCLAMYRELSQTELGAMIGIEPSTLVRTLDRMEKSGWVRRHPSSKDRRKNLIRATQRVEPVWKIIIREGQKVEKQAIAGISQFELRQLQAVIRRMVRNLQGSSDLPGTDDRRRKRSEPEHRKS